MKIVAGLGENKNILEASKKVDFPVKLIDSEEEFAELFFEDEAQAYVRGSLSASILIEKLRGSYENLYRASFLEIRGNKFLLAPVGIDEGDNLLQKLQIIDLCADFLKKINIEPKIAILSNGRAQDAERSQKIHESIAQGELLTRIIRDKHQAKHYFILLEKAIAEQMNIILAPDGITGNLIFRSLVLVGPVRSHGAITLGLDRIFIDTSRSLDVEGYVRALKFAKYLSEL
jgi:putative methanogen marker protein 4